MLATLDLGTKLMDNQYTSGSNSVVEFLPSKQAVAGSNPVSRSTTARFVSPARHMGVTELLDYRVLPNSSRRTP